jgi:protein-disulfide isomerase
MGTGPGQPRDSDEQRARTLKLAAAAGLAAVLAVVILVVVSQSGESSGDTDVETAGGDVAGLPQSGEVIGEASAPVTVTEFGDLQCPVCRQFSRTVIPDVLEGPVADGQANLRFANWAILGPDSVTAAEAALAAAPQNKLWDFVELFYENQGPENSGYVTDDFLEAIATEARLDVAAWQKARQDTSLGATLDEIDGQAVALGFGGTPSIAVSGPGGETALSGVPTAADIEQAIEEVS